MPIENGMVQEGGARGILDIRVELATNTVRKNVITLNDPIIGQALFYNVDTPY